MAVTPIRRELRGLPAAWLPGVGLLRAGTSERVAAA